MRRNQPYSAVMGDFGPRKDGFETMDEARGWAEKQGRTNHALICKIYNSSGTLVAVHTRNLGESRWYRGSRARIIAMRIEERHK